MMINLESVHIACGVFVDKDDLGDGDQCVVLGDVCDETKDTMPLTLSTVTHLQVDWLKFTRIATSNGCD